MLKHRRAIWIALWTFFSLSSFAYLGTLAPSYNRCVAEYGNATPDDKGANSQQMRASRFLRCEGIFLDENSVLLTAVATFIIAIFTVILAGASKRQEKWMALTAQVQAGIERAYLAIDNPAALVVPDAPMVPFGVGFQIFNSGRVPAEITEAIFKYFIGSANYSLEPPPISNR